MQRRHLLSLAAAFAAAVALPAAAHDFKAGAIQIKHPWARPTSAGAQVGGGYLTLVNTGKTPDRLVGGTTPGARSFEIHEMSMDGGIMKMRRLDQGLALPPGGTVTLKPGAYHIMFVGLSKPLKLGEKLPATLRFEKAGEVKVEFAVEQPQPQPPAGGHQHGMR